MLRYLPILISVALAIYALIDCVQSDESEVRNLPKMVWLIVIIVVAFVGPIAWLIAGRPKRVRAVGPPPPGQRATPPRPPLAPDDDPEFLAQLDKGNQDHERMLKQWEEDLRRREQTLRQGDQAPEATDESNDGDEAPPAR